MKFPWFKKIGIIFVPISIIGWIIFGAAIAYTIDIFIDIDSHSHSASDTIRPFILNLLIIGVVYSLIAWITSSMPSGTSKK
jgi:hypothetical protein